MNRKSPFSCCGGHRHAPPPPPHRFARASLRPGPRRATLPRPLPDSCAFHRAPSDAWSDASDNDPNLSNPTTATLDGLRPHASWNCASRPWPCAAFTHAGGPGASSCNCSAAAPSDLCPMPPPSVVGSARPDWPLPHLRTPRTAFPTLRNPIRSGRWTPPSRCRCEHHSAFAGCVSSMRPAAPSFSAGSTPNPADPAVGRRGGAGGVAAGLQPLGAAGEACCVDNGVPLGLSGQAAQRTGTVVGRTGCGPAPQPAASDRNRMARWSAPGATAKNWAEPGQCDSPEQLQSRLAEADHVQRELDPVAEGQSRLQRYPSLRHSGRGYVAGSWEQVYWSLEEALQCTGALTRETKRWTRRATCRCL